MDYTALVRSLREEAARRRRELQHERARHEETRKALAAANRLLVAQWLRGRLIDPADFDLIVGVTNTEDEHGRIVWSRLEALLRQLLDAKPHLAAPKHPDYPFDSHPRKVD